jgi:ABC-2 type transport system permease protein
VETIRTTHALFVRAMKRLYRRPFFLYMSLVQPLVWLLLFSQVMKNFGRAALPPGVSYITLFAPAVMLQTILFGSFQSGMAMVHDIDFGLLDKFLIAPINRMSILLGRAMADAVRMFAQAMIIVVASLAMGVRYVHGPLGVFGAAILAVLLGMGLAGLSNVVALRTKNAEATLMVGTFFVFPLLFLSPALVPPAALPHWIHTAGNYNPVAYAVQGARNLMTGLQHGHVLDTAIDWGQLGRASAFLVGIAVAGLLLARGAFRRATA